MARQNSKFIVAADGKKLLPSFNIYIRDRRTTVRLSPVVADAIEKIAERERCELDELYSYIDRKKGKGVSRATAIRDFALRYFIEAGTKAGHRRAGHGDLINRPKRSLRRAREQDQEEKAA
jgi:predicted DNA-binding ribbon-helix-helix protein